MDKRCISLVASATLSALFISGCKDAPKAEGGHSLIETAAPTTPTIAAPAVPDRPVLPDHNYDERRGWNYYYVAAISDEDREKGRAAGGVAVFQYLGLNDNGHHVLASMRPNGTVSHTASCSSSCRIIDYSYGGNMAYSPESIIGAAFQDAIRGRLVVADWAKDKVVEPVPPTVQSPPISTPVPVATEDAEDEPWNDFPAAEAPQE